MTKLEWTIVLGAWTLFLTCIGVLVWDIAEILVSH